MLNKVMLNCLVDRNVCDGTPKNHFSAPYPILSTDKMNVLVIKESKPLFTCCNIQISVSIAFNQSNHFVWKCWYTSGTEILWSRQCLSLTNLWNIFGWAAWYQCPFISETIWRIRRNYWQIMKNIGVHKQNLSTNSQTERTSKRWEMCL